MGRLKSPLAREATVRVRTFDDVRERLLAMTVLLGRDGVSGLIEHYALRGLEQDEEEFGFTNGQPVTAKGKPLPVLSKLTEAKRHRVLRHYAKVEQIGKRRAADQLRYEEHMANVEQLRYEAKRVKLGYKRRLPPRSKKVRAESSSTEVPPPAKVSRAKSASAAANP